MMVQCNTSRSSLIGWYFLGLAFFLIYFPTLWDLFHGLWKTEQNAHGPIVLAVASWFFVHKSIQIGNDRSVESRPASVLGWFVLAFSLLLYVAGRSQEVSLIELGSMIPLLAGIVLIFFGPRPLKRLWFALFFMLFMIPLPGSITDTLTQPMKILVSWGAENILFGLGYPIARNGVVLSIGQYQLLVADACAGLNSLFTLEALGLLYMNVIRHSSVTRNIVLATLIVPISYLANLIRVSLLCLVTYHFGDEAGQGFVHWFSGMALFLTALVIIIFVDGALRVGIKVGNRGGEANS